MKLSQVIPQAGDYWSLPNSDALQGVFSKSAADDFISQHGDHEFSVDRSRRGFAIFIIPDFSAGHKEFSAAKLADCRKWGSN
jgi:hypothetical protein